MTNVFRKNDFTQSDFKPFNTHLQVDYPAYTMVICQVYEIKAFAEFLEEFLHSQSKVMKQQLTVVVTRSSSSPFLQPSGWQQI